MAKVAVRSALPVHAAAAGASWGSMAWWHLWEMCRKAPGGIQYCLCSSGREIGDVFFLFVWLLFISSMSKSGRFCL